MKQKVEIKSPVARFKNVVSIKIPGIYGDRGDPLPQRLAKCVKPAAVSLQKVYRDVSAAGGHLYISDMFRSAKEQQKAHEDWKSGRKSSFSPPSCGSVHEAGRAIDIDAFDTGIGHKKMRKILNDNGWIHIVETLTGSECWHYEFRQRRWEKYKNQHGYAAMAHAMKKEIGNTIGIDRANRSKDQVRWLQQSLNTLMQLGLDVDGIYGEDTRTAVFAFQRAHRLQADGVAGPITRKKIQTLLG